MKAMLMALFVFAHVAGAEVHRDPLLHALRVLQTRVDLTTEADRAAAAGVQVPIAVLAATTALALLTRMPGVPWHKVPARFIVGKAGEASVYALASGSSMYLGAQMYKFVRRAREQQMPVDYATPAGLRRFFRAPLDEQYIVARRDPAFTKFLIQLGDSFGALEQGFTP